jgi:hypothetical protein
MFNISNQSWQVMGLRGLKGSKDETPALKFKIQVSKKFATRLLVALVSTC